MGAYLNPGNDLFQNSLNSMIYIDKTELIHFTNRIINTEEKLVCVSRPRRFGKSMALKMLSAYYSKGCDSRELFAGLKAGRKHGTGAQAGKRMAAFEKNLNHYDVLYIDMQGIFDEVLEDAAFEEVLVGFNRKKKEMDWESFQKIRHPMLAFMQKYLIADICGEGGYAEYVPEGVDSLGAVLQGIYSKTGNQFILLIDEWDCVFRNYETDTFLQDKYIDWLRGMVKNAKMLPAYALVYMTGILPVKRYGTQSALNNFNEYTFLEPLGMAEFSGFTEEEVKELCREYDVDFGEMHAWYNGYYFEDVGRVYNPRSVVCAVTNKKFKSYWTSTGTYESVKKQIEMDFDGLKQMVVTLLGGGRCRVNTSKFQNDMVTFHSADDVLTFLVHLGYLGYDSGRKEAYIPNREIRDEFVNAIEGKKYARTFSAIAQSEELLNATLEGNEEKVAEMIELAHEEHASILKYNDENALSCILRIAYYEAQEDYDIVREMPSGKGFADITFLPRPKSGKPAIAVELKWNKDAGTAIEQIKNRNYAGWLKDYVGEVLLVGINYDKDSKDKKHSCKIERVKKE